MTVTEAKGVTRHTWSVRSRLHTVLHDPGVIYRFVMAQFDTARSKSGGYPRSLPTSTFRHSRTRDKSSPWVIARRVSTCARINVTRRARVGVARGYYFTQFPASAFIMRVLTSNRIMFNAQFGVARVPVSVTACFHFTVDCSIRVAML